MRRTSTTESIPLRTWRWTLGAVVMASASGLGLFPSAYADIADVSDLDITNAIEDELLRDETINSNDVDVTTAEGIVELSGEVDNILEKDRAETIGSTIVGVRGIVNEIEIVPSNPRTDAELRKAIDRALLEDPATESYEVTAKVAGGMVTLSGTVDSWQERDLCETVTKGVRGVRGVSNAIEVDYKENRPDYEIQKEIEARLANDVLVDDLLLSVAVNDGRVTLDGSLGSLAEEYRARADAWVAGVTNVDSENVDIEWGLRDEMRREDTYASQTDAEIKDAVKDAFLYDPRVVSFNPDVTVKNGAVTLSGRVDNMEAKLAAEDDARNIIGVRRVQNNLKVRIDDPNVFAELESDIKSALANDPYVESYDVNVDTVGSAATLSGEVNTSFEKWEAEQVALGVQGVTRVFNNIDYEHQWHWKPDWEIKDSIQNQLWWSPFVDADEVNVTVDDGLATLTGTVDTWSERQDAEENAFDGGAKDVDNNLSVDFEYYGPYRRFDRFYRGYPYTYPY